MEQAPGQASPEATAELRRSPEAAAELVVQTIQAHADSLLRLARKHSLCADDAQDAYQRAMEIFMRRAATLEPQTVAGWVHTVVKHEAMAVRASRLQIVSAHDVDLDAREAGHLPSPEERMLSFDMVTRSAEALQRLKPQEVRALWLKAAGHSYAQIAESTGWTYTKVNRCIAEGRKSFLARYASIESGEECDRWAPVVSAMIDGEATPQQVIDARPHLRH
jgi:RNA polymerase sigma factor (sigma-70 family)